MFLTRNTYKYVVTTGCGKYQAGLYAVVISESREKYRIIWAKDFPKYFRFKKKLQKKAISLYRWRFNTYTKLTPSDYSIN